jgi:hypothetical protein
MRGLTTTLVTDHGNCRWSISAICPEDPANSGGSRSPDVRTPRIDRLALAVVIVLTALPAALFTHERIPVHDQDQLHLLHSGKLALQSRSFRILYLMIFFVIAGMSFIGVLATYANIFYIFGGDKSSGATWNGFYGTAAGLGSSWRRCSPSAATA